MECGYVILVVRQLLWCSGLFPEDYCEVAKVLWVVTKALPLLKYFEIFAVIAMWLLRFFFSQSEYVILGGYQFVAMRLLM